MNLQAFMQTMIKKKLYLLFTKFMQSDPNDTFTPAVGLFKALKNKFYDGYNWGTLYMIIAT